MDPRKKTPYVTGTFFIVLAFYMLYQIGRWVVGSTNQEPISLPPAQSDTQEPGRGAVGKAVEKLSPPPPPGGPHGNAP